MMSTVRGDGSRPLKERSTQSGRQTGFRVVAHHRISLARPALTVRQHAGIVAVKKCAKHLQSDSLKNLSRQSIKVKFKKISFRKSCWATFRIIMPDPIHSDDRVHCPLYTPDINVTNFSPHVYREGLNLPALAMQI